MKSYSFTIPEQEKNAYAAARLEGANVSYKDLTQVCGRIRKKKASWAEQFLVKASEGEIPVLFKRFNKKTGHRKELGGAKGRYPKKAAQAVLGVLKSAMTNARVKNISDDLTVEHISANKLDTYPRMASKGRRSRSFFETARVEIVLKGKPSLEKKVEVKKPEAKPETTTAAKDAEVEKKIEAEIKKEIIQKEEAKKEKSEEVKSELKKEKDNVEKRQMRPRQNKGEKQQA